MMRGSLDRLGLLLANGLWTLANAGDHRRLMAACADPARAQAGRLAAVLDQAAPTAHGRHLGLQASWSPAQFQENVPVTVPDSLAPWIDRIASGEPNVLTRAPVLAFERTSGSTRGARLIPYTAPLRREFTSAVGAWLFDLYSRRPKLWSGSAYWSVSPLARSREFTSGGIPVGFEDDTEYLSGWQGRLARTILRVPTAVARIADLEAARYVTLRLLLDDESLGLVSVWNPSYLLLMIDSLDRHAESLIHDVRSGSISPPHPVDPPLLAALSAGLRARPQRAASLARLRSAKGRLDPVEVWPRLSVVSCWGSASAAPLRGAVERLVPGVEIQPKGLLATEGVVSVPLWGRPGALLALTSHFYEFRPIDDQSARPLLAHQLERGRRYEVLMSTSGGLLRYALGDEVEVVGFEDRGPLIEFVGRRAGVCDLVGEKLAESFVVGVLARVLEGSTATPSLCFLAPEDSLPLTPARYVLVIEAALDPSRFDGIAAAVDQGLQENPHYAYARSLGQLGPVRCLPVPTGSASRFIDGCVALGQRPGDVKPPALRVERGWPAWMTGVDVCPRRSVG